jgi:hypothetical protein
MKQTFYFFVAILFFITGCDSPTEVSNHFDYSIEQKMDCYCSQNDIWVNLFITSDTVSNAIRISDNKQLNYNEFKYYKSIKELFEWISETDTTVYNLVVSTNSEYNFPSFIFIYPKPVVTDTITWIIADGELSYSTKNYKKLK